MDSIRKAATLANISYPTNLPVSQYINKIKEAINTHQLIIVCGETGSGKTTQLPKILLEMGFADNLLIGHTQPRKVAAKSLAHRIGKELENHDLVGYKIRFKDKTKTANAIKLMTDGILLQEIKSHPLLKEYSAIIIDEAHERSLNIDFILGYLKTILIKRKDLKIIITSATIDNNKFSKFFNNAPIIDIQGATYPVDIIYQPLEVEKQLLSLNEAIYNALISCFSIELGNTLIFLPGEREIKECINFLNKTSLRQYQIISLFSRQNEYEQNKIFINDGSIKIIVSTNIAETSITIPGIKFVIDSGLARIKRYSNRYKVEQLHVEEISKANANQRSGRAGRVSHGMCVRLYSEDNFKKRKDFADPEILTSNLANVILKLVSLKIGDPLKFVFLDQPLESSYSDGFKTLFQLKALTIDNKITTIGQKISLIPIDVSLARMLIAAGSEFNCLEEVLIIVSFLAIPDPREVPQEFQQYAREKQQLWQNSQSDFITIINLWQWYQNLLQHKKSNKKLLGECREFFVSMVRLKEWRELYSQLKETMNNLISFKKSDILLEQNYKNIHQALMTGLLNNIGQKDLMNNFYNGTNNKKFFIHPSSFINKAQWICSAQLIQTTKLYARINASIDPHWLLPICKHLVKYTYSNEKWDKKRGEVVAIETTLLSGLIIYKQKVSYTKINQQLAREIFIKEGLVLGELVDEYPFLRHNKKVIKELEKLEDKIRLDLIVVDDELFAFYNEVIPTDITDIRSFEFWHKSDDNKAKLNINLNEFINKFINPQAVILNPDSIISNKEKINLKYVFNTEKDDDGVSAIINIAQLTRINPNTFDWLVPSLIRDKLNYIIKALPKNIRLQLNPLNEFITNFLEYANTDNQLIAELISYIKKNNIAIEKENIACIKLPKHLVFHFKIFEQHKLIASGDDILTLRVSLKEKLSNLVTNHTIEYTRQDIKEWMEDLNQLLKEIKLNRNNQTITGFLSLVVKNKIVNLTVINNFVDAEFSTKKGLLQLVSNQLNQQLKYIGQKQFLSSKEYKQIVMFFNDIYDPDILLKECINYTIMMSADLSILPRSKEQFEAIVSDTKQQLVNNALLLLKKLYEIAGLYHQIKIKIINHKLSETILLQLNDLIYGEFLKYVYFENLSNFPRYLKAILIRLDKYEKNPLRDLHNQKEIDHIYNIWYERLDEFEVKLFPIKQEMYDFKYKIEELRVSLFAQELKTPYPISSKRLFKELQLLFNSPYA